MMILIVSDDNPSQSSSIRTTWRFSTSANAQKTLVMPAASAAVRVQVNACTPCILKSMFKSNCFSSDNLVSFISMGSSLSPLSGLRRRLIITPSIFVFSEYRKSFVLPPLSPGVIIEFLSIHNNNIYMKITNTVQKKWGCNTPIFIYNSGM